MTKTTPQEIAAIFYSGQFGFTGDQQTAAKIAFLINEGYVTINKLIISSKEEFFSVSSNTTTMDLSPEAAGGSREHVALKLLAVTYLERVHKQHASCEVSFAGYLPDVISADKSIICECGHTNNPEKIFTYFSQPGVRRIIQIPYPDGEEHVYGYQLQATCNLIPFLEFEAQESSISIKKILNRPR